MTTTASTRRARFAALWRGLLRHGGTAVAVVVVAFFGMGFAVIPVNASDASSAVMIGAVAGLVAAVGCGVSMVWRSRWPLAVFCVNAALARLLPLEPLGTLIALSWVLVHASVRRVLWTSAVAALVTVVTLGRDALRSPPAVVLSTTDPVTGEAQVMDARGYLALGAVLMVLAVGGGLLRRYREHVRRAERAAEHQAGDAARLREQLNRQEERELIAREMHDTVAHHLSLVSLHAAALEVTSNDPVVPESAQAMRASAHRALEEMRTLISSLRDSSEGGYTGAAPSLTDLPRLVDDARDAGALVEADVSVAGGEDAPPGLTRAVYRIVQESLTNAIKHAPASPVRVVVRAVPEVGSRSSWRTGGPEHRATAAEPAPG